ncbi:MAG: ArsR family transcriptional regulator [Pseudomonadota bacterium]
MQAILDYLKQSGERLDSEIAAATGLSLANVRLRVTDLHARGAVMVCRSIRYKDGKEIDGLLCRVSGYIPPAAPGRKSKAHLQAKATAAERS